MNISATDSKGCFYYLQIRKLMDLSVSLKTFVLHSLRNNDADFTLGT